jgi:hypothetical protein
MLEEYIPYAIYILTKIILFCGAGELNPYLVYASQDLSYVSNPYIWFLNMQNMHILKYKEK